MPSTRSAKVRPASSRAKPAVVTAPARADKSQLDFLREIAQNDGHQDSTRALPCVRQAIALRARCFPHELQEELDAFLAKSFYSLTPFALLDRLERLERAGQMQASAARLAQEAALWLSCTAQQVGRLLERASRARLVLAVRAAAATEFQLTARGRLAVRSGRATRLALFRLRVAATPAYACGVVDHEESHDEDDLDDDGGCDHADEQFDPGHPMDPNNPLQLRGPAAGRRTGARSQCPQSSHT